MSNSLKLKCIKLRAKILKSLEQKKVFFMTVLISFVIAIIIGVSCALLSPAIDINDYHFTYGAYNGNLKSSVYLLLNVSAVIAPTTITFSGTIMVLHNNKQSVVKNTFLFIIMVAMVVLSIGIQLVDNYLLLIMCALLIVLLTIAAIGISWSISEPSQIQPFHKREVSDGKMIT